MMGSEAHIPKGRDSGQSFTGRLLLRLNDGLRNTLENHRKKGSPADYNPLNA